LKQILTEKGNNGNNVQKFPLFPFAKSTSVRGNKGNNAYRLIPYSPRWSVGAF
jgi:hypothetical protein